MARKALTTRPILITTTYFDTELWEHFKAVCHLNSIPACNMLNVLMARHLVDDEMLEPSVTEGETPVWLSTWLDLDVRAPEMRDANRVERLKKARARWAKDNAERKEVRRILREQRKAAQGQVQS